MSAAKYPELTANLELKIRQGAYRGKLPTTRQMEAEFGVSRQTLTNALRPLIEKKLLIAERRNGIKINAEQLDRGLIGIVARGPLENLNSNPVFKPLQERMSADGFESLMLDVSHGITPGVRNLLGNFVGLIFTNSSLTLEMAEYLELKQIPFVSCNQLTIYSRLNFVQYDWAGAIRKIAALFASKGYQKQCLFFQGLLEGYDRFIKKQWKSIKLDLGLPLLKADKIELNWQTELQTCLEEYLKALYEIQEYPQLLIFWRSIDEDNIGLLRKGKYKLPDSCLIAGPGYTPDLSGKNIITLAVNDYDPLLSAGYEALRELILAPNKKLIHRLIDYPIVWHKNKDFDNGGCINN